MITKSKLRLSLRGVPIVMAGFAICFSSITEARAATVLGPLNPGFEYGSLNWNSGASGGTAGNVVFNNQPTNGPSVPGINCVLQTSDGTGNADLRADNFALGIAQGGSNAIVVEFDYNIIDQISFGDQIRVGLRFLDSGGGFVAENNFHIGTPNGDTGAQGWQHFKGTAISYNAATRADLRMTMNVFVGDDTWSSGPVLYDNFTVYTTPTIGPANPGFESGGASWNAGGPGGVAGSENFLNFPTNGPSVAGTNSALMTADGTVGPPNGNDMRANEFGLGAASLGQRSLKFEFDYNILDQISFGDKIRVGTRYFDSSGNNFVGEHNFYIGTPTGDTGANGWRHYVGYATPPANAYNTDIRVSMNIFGDDTWSSGPVLFDNFSQKLTRILGPSNRTFENGPQSWNTGGSSGAVVYYNAGSNGPSALGTNCLLETSLGGGTSADFRADNWFLGPAAAGAQPVTISFDYNILNLVNSGDQIRVGLRFFDGGNNFVGEFNSHIGSPNNDTGGQGWLHFSATTTPPSGAQLNDIRVTMNIFGDDTWSSGPVLFDNFSVVPGANTAPAVTNPTIGTLKNTAVTRLFIGSPQGPTDADGDPTSISYITQPAHGSVTTDGSSFTYTPTNGYTGNDSFTFDVTDGAGGLTPATANVIVSATAGTNKFTTVTNATGNAVLTFSGAPGVNYVLQSTVSLTPPPAYWVPQATNSANASGVVTFTNLPNASSVFYRIKLVP